MELALVTEWIDTPTAAVWAIVSDFANPQRLVPTIALCEVSGVGVGAVRTVHSSRGLRIEERLTESDPTRLRFAYEVLESGDMPFAGVDQYQARVTLVPEFGGTTIIWHATGTLSGPAEPVSEFLGKLYRGAIARIAILAAADA